MLKSYFLEHQRGSVWQVILQNAIQNKTPISGTIELTSTCNFSCKHCYIEKSQRKVGSGSSLELYRLEKFFDEIRSAGCIRLLITGGEPLCHPDFSTIWKLAHSIGLRLTLFTNGSLIGADHLRLFKEFPPEAIEISVYSYSSLKDEAGNISTSLEKLKDLNTCSLTIKSPILVSNVGDIKSIMEYAILNDFGFRMDPIIHPSLNGGIDTLKQRVSVSEAVRLVLLDKNAPKEIRESYSKEHTIMEPENDFTGCTGGLYTFHIGANGSVNLCSMFRSQVSNIYETSFLNSWEKLKSFRESGYTRKANRPYRECDSCGLKSICVDCPAVPVLHKRELNYIDNYICDYTKMLAEKVEI